MKQIRFEPDDVEIETEAPATILEMSLDAGIPHTHVCGGRARCSTCRVLVRGGLQHCDPRNEKEQSLANRLQFEPSIRLACQTRFTGAVTVRRLVLDPEDIGITNQLVADNRGRRTGCERKVAILFSDIRGFTSLSESLYPYDVIHLLNRYFASMLAIIEEQGGRVDNLIGDGIMAVFGEEEPDTASLNAVRAGLRMVEQASKFEGYVRATYGCESFQIGVGVHCGLAVIGTVGAGQTVRRTAIGDAVNLASRVESANKSAGTQFLISQPTYDEVREHVQIGRTIETALKGKTGQFKLYEVVSEAPPV